MKNIKSFVFASLVTIICFFAIVINSCSVDNCSGINCINGGACTNGACICPVGYYGSTCQNLAATHLSFDNYAPSQATIVCNGNSENVPAYGNLSLEGLYRSHVSTIASVYGQYGDTTSFNFVDSFPSSGTTHESLNIPSNLFYLEIENDGYTSPITSIAINVGLSDQVTLSVNLAQKITQNSNPIYYYIGYFPAHSNAQITLTLSDGITQSFTIFPSSYTFTNNQVYVAHATI